MYFEDYTIILMLFSEIKGPLCLRNEYIFPFWTGQTCIYDIYAYIQSLLCFVCTLLFLQDLAIMYFYYRTKTHPTILIYIYFGVSLK
jgi:hypothetical protein